jgi:hypothetical protein
MTRPTDLAERIARLERLLDIIEQTRRGEKPGPPTGDADAPADRIRELTSLLEQRAALPGLDEADGIAMRALLDQIRSMTTELRARASDVSERLETVAAGVAHGTRSLESQEDIC